MLASTGAALRYQFTQSLHSQRDPMGESSEAVEQVFVDRFNWRGVIREQSHSLRRREQVRPTDRLILNPVSSRY
jgi:hypothetical protein